MIYLVHYGHSVTPYFQAPAAINQWMNQLANFPNSRVWLEVIRTKKESHGLR